MKAIFDRVDELKPWGMLLGDDMSMVSPGVRRRIKRAEKK
jgi:hypothetical protein